MSRFSVVYEDPEYGEYDEGDWEDDIYIEPGAIKPFDQWSFEAQNRLIADVVKEPQEDASPFNTINS
jgi:hypothetical protein